MNQNHHNNSPLIYQMDSSSEDQNQIYSDLSTSSKSNQNKKHQQETQVSQIPTDNFQTTQIIKIKPLSQENTQNQPNKQSLTSNPKPKQLQQLIFSQSSQDKQEKNDSSQDEDLQSPAKLRRSKRKRQRSATKKRLPYQKQTIFDDSQISVKQQKLSGMMQFKQMEKMPSYLQIQDSQRYFDIKKQFKGPIQQEKNETYQKKLFQNSQQIPFQRKRYELKKEYQQQQVFEIQQFRQNYEQKDEIQNFYDNDDGSQEQSIPKFKTNNKNSLVKVLKNLPKEIVVQTTVQTLVMNLVPKGLKLSCTFVIDKRFMGLSTQYNLIINSTNKTVLSAKKEHFSFTSSKFIISMNSNYITKRKDNLGFVGRLISNFSGTVYQLTKRQIDQFNNSQNLTKNQESKDQEKQNESLQAIISFENNLWGYGGMRKMQITKLNKQKLTEKDKIKKVNFQQVYQRRQISKLMKIQTCKPIYNKTTKHYSIDFDNKVKIPSAKNMILQYKQTQKDKKQNTLKNDTYNKDKKIEQKCLLIAKQKDDRYLVQVGYPLSLYQAFAACLANNDSKLLVN